jgi:hypothetical protein
MVFLSLTDKCRPTVPPDALSAMLRKPRDGEVEQSLKGEGEMIGGVIAFRKSNEDALERRADDYVSRRIKRNAVKYRPTAPYPKISEPDVF